MRKKIADALRTKYQRFGLSNEALDRIALAKEKTVTKDEDIETGIADLETMELIAGEVQKMRDGEIQKRTDLQRSYDTYKASHPETQPGNPPQTSPVDEPEWAVKLREQNERILGEFAKRDAAQRQQNAAANVRAALEKAGCSNPGILRLTLKGFALAEGETEDQAVARLTADYNQNVKDAFGEGVIPPVGSGAPSGDPSKYAEKMNSFLEEQGLLPKQQ